MRRNDIIISCLVVILSASLGRYAVAQNVDVDRNAMMGMPMGAGSEEADRSICPEGARVVDTFMAAWQKGDYKTMYGLLDEKSREGYSYDEARFDFMFMEFKPYNLSSIRKDGDDFEFYFSAGDWKDGDKEVKKMLISGKSFRIIMTSRGEVFKKSADSYFN